MGSPLAEVVLEADRRYRLFVAGDTWVVAVSGGPDSMALLDVLAELAPERGIALAVAHLDHGLRSESAEEAAFVAHHASERGLPVRLEAADVARRAADRGLSLETAARQARYVFLAQVARALDATTVAAAHHADDQAETVLANLIRGTGLAGLAGMAPVAAFPVERSDDAPLRLVRPLLSASRADVMAHVHARGISYRDDPSNRDPAFLRNRVRHAVMPLLEEINPRVREALLRTAATARDDLAVLEAEASTAWDQVAADEGDQVTLDLAGWERLPAGLQRRVIRRALATLKADLREVGLDQLEAVRALASQAAGTAVDLAGAVRAQRYASAIALSTARRHAGLPERIPATSLPVPGEASLASGWRLRAIRRARSPGDPTPLADRWTAVLGGDGMEELVVRTREPGDVIRPLGMAGRSKTLQDLFVDLRVPRAQREGWPVVVAGSQIVWVPGLRLAESARVTPSTTVVVEIEALPPPEVRGTV